MENIAKANVGGVFTFEHYRDGKKIDEWTTKNIMTNEGLDYLLDASVANAAQISTWYVAPFKGNYTPDGSETGATVATDATEATEYTLGTRPAYVPGTVASQSVDNSASKASFTINATVTIYGAFLTGDSAKSGTGSKCLCISRFPGQRDLLNTDELLVTYTISAQDVV
jgi:hypothetical protein